MVFYLAILQMYTHMLQEKKLSLIFTKLLILGQDYHSPLQLM